MVVAKRKPWRVTDKAALAWHGASELSKVNFQTDMIKRKSLKNTLKSLRKEPEIEGIKTVVHLALLISILILVLLVSLFALLSNDPI